MHYIPSAPFQRLRLSGNDLQFTQHVVKECLEHGISLRFELPYHFTGENCTGYFSEYDASLGVEVTPHFINTLAHEYAHFLQWKDEFCSMPETYTFLEIVEDYALGKNLYPDDVVDAAFDYVAHLELDAEGRALQIIKDWKLKVNIREYCFDSCMNVWSYFFTRNFGSNVEYDPSLITPFAPKRTIPKGVVPPDDLLSLFRKEYMVEADISWLDKIKRILGVDGEKKNCSPTRIIHRRFMCHKRDNSGRRS